MHNVEYKIENKGKKNMKEEKISCRTVRYREFPDLLFGTSQEDGPVYFDATHFIWVRGDACRHNVRDFRASFHHWITALTDVYGIDKENMIIRDEASGHLLIDELFSSKARLWAILRTG